MPSRAYRFLTVNRFQGYEDRELVSSYQSMLSAVGTNPRTHLKLVETNYLNGFHRLECNHEVRDRRPHRFGDEAPYDRSSVAAPNEPYEVFFRPGDEYLIFKGPGSAARGAFNRLNKDFPGLIDVGFGGVDFAYVLDRIKGDVAGTWFTGLPGRVRSAGFFGDNVRLDPSVTSYDPRTMSALYLDLQVDGYKSTVQVMITAGRGVVIYENWSVNHDLEFLLGIKPLLFGGNPPRRGRARKSEGSDSDVAI